MKTGQTKEKGFILQSSFTFLDHKKKVKCIFLGGFLLDFKIYVQVIFHVYPNLSYLEFSYRMKSSR